MTDGMGIRGHKQQLSTTLSLVLSEFCNVFTHLRIFCELGMDDVLDSALDDVHPVHLKDYELLTGKY
jgi:hypothetical protein